MTRIETMPPPGKTWGDLQKWGRCRRCGGALFGWSALQPGDPRSTACGRPDCERPVELLGPEGPAETAEAYRHGRA
ncbi:MAG: hypothetical protein Kow00114_27170 [Kiloniellaceae bacterium]